MKQGYTYEDLQRAKIEVLVSSLLKELAWQDKLVLYEVAGGKKISDSETISTFEDRMCCMEDEDYNKFIDKLLDVLSNM